MTTDDPTTQPEPGTSVEAVLAQVHREHRLCHGGTNAYYYCLCGDWHFDGEDHAAHVASVQAAALAGMLPVGTVREEWGYLWPDGSATCSLYGPSAERVTRALWPRGCKIVRRIRTAYADTVTEWEEQA